MLDKVKHAVATAVDAAAGLVGVRLSEEPGYEVLGRAGEAEIRRYGARRVAETEAAGAEGEARDEGFRRLADYIFGRNAGEARIAMTAPVAQEGAGTRIPMTAPVAQSGGPGAYVIRFFLPASLATPPAPLDPAVRIAELPEETFAALRFSGATDASAVAAAKLRLRESLEGSGWEAEAEPVAWFYDPPWTPPPLRRTEVAVPVRRRG
jgi:hypothetical protein